ncbi:hypothetical protein SAMN02745146_0066 [Hymenobacter daecheongensis DSM 21074]|uniref:Peptidase S24/S26A/S26B/S26C domain-containing protein n=1 Tax=Hymenobacter daecheongensis DSM 21074 TaxID=1121955 RepID=A0A1M6LUZ5_9BACT|nr:S24 family peptidase [Hymenobacter daecheongensis]SHJ75068.1 hypothetical protein SAMN02745146_0066 [Hymenobacter daecheongensis DSM 21074]
MQPQSFNDIKTGRRYVTIEMVHDTCNTYSINPNFILFGHRPVILPENVELDVEENVEVNRVVKINHVYPPLQTQVHTEILVATQDTSDNPTFSLINYKAAANYLTGYQSQEFYQKLAPVSLPRQLVGNPKQGIVLQIEGDSMAPKFQHGDYVAAVLLDRSEWPSIRDLDCYVVVSATHGVQFKRIKNRIPKYGFIRCRSDNRRHQSYNIEEENLLQLFRFVLHISPDASNPDDTLYNKVESIEERVEDQRDMYEQLMAQMQQMQKQLQQPTTH